MRYETGQKTHSRSAWGFRVTCTLCATASMQVQQPESTVGSDFEIESKLPAPIAVLHLHRRSVPGLCSLGKPAIALYPAGKSSAPTARQTSS